MAGFLLEPSYKAPAAKADLKMAIYVTTEAVTHNHFRAATGSVGARFTMNAHRERGIAVPFGEGLATREGALPLLREQFLLRGLHLRGELQVASGCLRQFYEKGSRFRADRQSGYSRNVRRPLSRLR
jgi:hypothetical protein